MEIIEFDPKYTQEIYDFVMDIKANEIGWRSDASELHDIRGHYIGSGGNFWIALDSGRVVGTTALQHMGHGQGYLKRMYLAKEYRGSGLAQKLLSLLIQHAKDQELREIYLATTRNSVTERAIGFYTKMGFKYISSLPEGFYDEDNDVHMKLLI